jgi:tetratricopeptide (TPR) repeat protein
MPATTPNLTRIATTFVCHGLFGPLGAFLGAGAGAVAADLGPEIFKELIQKVAEQLGEKAGDTLVGDRLKELADRLGQHPIQLDKLLRECLGEALRDIHRRTGTQFDDPPYFKLWNEALKSPAPLQLHTLTSPEFLNASEATLDALYTRTLQDLAAEGQRLRISESSILLPDARIPAPLLAILHTELPEAFREAYNRIDRPEYQEAWNRADRLMQEAHFQLTSHIDATTTENLAISKGIDQKQDQLLAGQRELMRVITENAAANQSASKEKILASLSLEDYRKWATQKLEVIQSSGDPLYARLMGKNRFADAKQVKDESIWRLQEVLGIAEEAARLGREALKTLPKELYERAFARELQLDWLGALSDYRQAWELSKDRDYGFKYADFAARLNHHNEAIAAYEQLLPLYPEPADRAKILNNLAILYSDTQRYTQAEDAYTEAFTIRRALAQQNPAAFNPDVASTLNNLAILYRNTQRHSQAEATFTEALTIRRALAQEDPDAYNPDLATTLNNLANLYEDTQRHTQAEDAYKEALTILSSLTEQNPDAYNSDLATTLNNLAYLYRETQSYPRAEQSNIEAESILEPLFYANPAAHGNLMAKILCTRALIAIDQSAPAETVCPLLHRAHTIAYDPIIKAYLQALIDQHCPPSTGT